MPGASPPEPDEAFFVAEAAVLAVRAPLARMRHPGLRCPGLANWDGRLFPGEYVFAEVAAGGIFTMTGPGEHVAVRLTQPAWIRLFHPPSAARRAAEAGCSEVLTVDIQQLCGRVWEARVGLPAAPRRVPATLPAAGADVAAHLRRS